MPILETKINKDLDSFIENFEHNKQLSDELASKLHNIKKMGSASSIEKHQSRGKLTVRDRIDKLKDENSEILEFSELAAYHVYEDIVPAAGIITCIIKIKNRYCIVVANDATVKGGTYYPLTVKKHLRAQEIALENHLPCIYLVDSGGAFLPMQDQVFPDKEHFGRIFYNQAKMSSMGIPQIAAVMGSCTAGGAYVPAMSDEAIIVNKTGTIFLGGPPLVKAAIGEIATAEELGGAKLHTRLSGVADHFAEHDDDAIAKLRSIIDHLPQEIKDKKEFQEPKYDINELFGILEKNSKKPYDIHEIIARLVDKSNFEEFKADYGKTLVTGFAKIGGHPIGIIGNNGVLFSETAIKGAHFVEICSKRKIPLLFLQNITGFMVGKRAEAGGIAKNGAKMVQAVAATNVPKITIIVGGSFGAGNYAMSGRAYQPRFLWMWPNARISVMGGDQAANVMSTIKKDQSIKKGQEITESEIHDFKKPILEKYEKEGNPYYASARLWDDGVISPTATRNILITALNAMQNKPIGETIFPVFRM
ncbi:MAG: methylcrotonoyl-CoA carboxylase [Candidatus Marinimicrobia bacterium]|nr:methylcrotonoyl-CoA carboxylase [Candidatus Neomarinimicrobiota bacterium]